MLYLFGGARIILSLPAIRFRQCYHSVKRTRNKSIITCITSSKLNILQFKQVEKKQQIIYLSFSLQYLNLFIIMYYAKCVVVNKNLSLDCYRWYYSLTKKKQYCHMEYYNLSQCILHTKQCYCIFIADILCET